MTVEVDADIFETHTKCNFKERLQHEADNDDDDDDEDLIVSSNIVEGRPSSVKLYSLSLRSSKESVVNRVANSNSRDEESSCSRSASPIVTAETLPDESSPGTINVDNIIGSNRDGGVVDAGCLDFLSVEGSSVDYEDGVSSIRGAQQQQYSSQRRYYHRHNNYRGGGGRHHHHHRGRMQGQRGGGGVLTMDNCDGERSVLEVPRHGVFYYHDEREEKTPSGGAGLSSFSVQGELTESAVIAEDNSGAEEQNSLATVDSSSKSLNTGLYSSAGWEQNGQTTASTLAEVDGRVTVSAGGQRRYLFDDEIDASKRWCHDYFVDSESENTSPSVGGGPPSTRGAAASRRGSYRNYNKRGRGSRPSCSSRGSRGSRAGSSRDMMTPPT